MIRRLRLLLPPAPVLLGLLAIYLVFVGLLLYTEWRIGVRVVAQGFSRPGVFIPLVSALAYGGYRVVAFHPFYRPNYRAWLERSPWTGGRPLPLGPVALVWEDGVVLALLAFLAVVDPALDPIRLVACFLVGYLTLLSVAFAPTGALSFAYVIAFGLGLVVRLTPSEPRVALAIAIVLGAISQVGLRRSLHRFPWSLDWLAPLISLAQGDRLAYETTTMSGCGWPFDQLGLRWAHPSTFRLARRDALLLGPLAGWWLFSLEAAIPNPLERAGFAGFLAGGIAFHLASFRVMNYVGGYLPPISLVGRLATFRWIIPGYDVIFVAPACTLIVPALAAGVLPFWGATAESLGPICLALAVFIALNMGPDLKRWQLTGQHRIIPIKGNGQVKVG